MTRYKKYLNQSVGVRLNNDFPYLPIDIGGLTLEEVVCNIIDGRVVISHIFTSLIVKHELMRDGHLQEVE